MRRRWAALSSTCKRRIGRAAMARPRGQSDSVGSQLRPLSAAPEGTGQAADHAAEPGGPAVGGRRRHGLFLWHQDARDGVDVGERLRMGCFDTEGLAVVYRGAHRLVVV